MVTVIVMVTGTVTVMDDLLLSLSDTQVSGEPRSHPYYPRPLRLVPVTVTVTVTVMVTVTVTVMDDLLR
jgi:hypothetical protein